MAAVETIPQRDDRIYAFLLQDAPQLAHIVAQNKAWQYGSMAADDYHWNDRHHWARLTRLWHTRVLESHAIAYPGEK